MIKKRSPKTTPKLNKTYKEIAEYCGVSESTLRKTYFTQVKPKKKNMGRALDVGVYLLKHGVSELDIEFMAEVIEKHKERIKGFLQ